MFGADLRGLGTFGGALVGFGADLGRFGGNLRRFGPDLGEIWGKFRDFGADLGEFGMNLRSGADLGESRGI